MSDRPRHQPFLNTRVFENKEVFFSKHVTSRAYLATEVQLLLINTLETILIVKNNIIIDALQLHY